MKSYLTVVLVKMLYDAVVVNSECTYDYNARDVCYTVNVNCTGEFTITSQELNSILLYSPYNNDVETYKCNPIEMLHRDYGPIYGKFHQIFLTYKRFSTDRSLFYSTNNQEYDTKFNIKGLITTLDISNSGYQEMPDMSALPNLKYLNISRNSLNTVELSGHLTSLVELDMSHNLINSFEGEKLSDINFNSLVNMNLSHNYLVIIPNSIFKPFVVLIHLDISHNFIDVLNTLTFEGLQLLQYLNISNNRLYDIGESLSELQQLRELDISHNQLQIVKKIHFQNLDEIVSLNLQYNDINVIENFAFENLRKLEEIDLSFNLIKFIDKGLFKNTVNLKKVYLTKNNIHQLAKDSFENAHLSTFAIKNNCLNGSLLTGTFEGLDLVNSLDLSDQNISAIEDYAFLGLKDAVSILLKSNQINTIAYNSFRRLKNLNSLDLSNNFIAAIDFNKEDLTNLQYFYLQSNEIIYIKKEQMANLHQLAILDLSFNKILSFEQNSFKNLSNLLKLIISNNPVNSELQENTFVGLISLQSLDISVTKLVILKNNSLNGLSQLKYLNVSYCKISEIEYNAFIDITNIETIDLSWNELELFSIHSSHFKCLRELNLEGNHLKDVDYSTMIGLSTIHKLYLSNNCLKNLTSQSFYELKNLVTVTLSGINVQNMCFNKTNNMVLTTLVITRSNLQYVKFLKLNNVQRLENIILNHDNISVLSTTDFFGVKNLNSLDLSFNQISYIQPGTFKDNAMLINLNISHNLLFNISYGVFRGLTNIDTIDLSFNNLLKLQSENLNDVKNLRCLIIDYNHIKEINTVGFKGSLLSQLSLGHNPLPCELLVRLREQQSFSITSVYEDSNKENVDGITCNFENNLPKNTSIDDNKGETNQILKEIKIFLQNATTNYNVTTDTLANIDSNAQYIKDILLNISRKIDFKTSAVDTKVSATTQKYLNLEQNITDTIIQYNNITKDFLVSLKKIFEENSNRTNSLIKSSINGSSPYINVERSLTNKTSSEINSKEMLELTLFHHQIDLERQVEQLNAKLAQQQTPKPEKYKENDGAHLFIMEICIVLILLLLVGLTLYKMYKSRVYVLNRRSVSTRPITELDANSEL